MTRKQRRRIWSLGPILLLCSILAACQPAASEGAYERGMEAFRLADYDTAMKEFQTAANEEGRKAEAYRGEGMIYLARKDYPHAITLFDLSLENLDVKNDEFREDVLFYKAEAYVGARQLANAKEIYQSLTEGKNPSLALYFLGVLSLEENDTAGAETYFQTAIETENSYDLCILIYEAYADRGMEANGSDYLTVAQEMSGTENQDYYQAGRVYDYLEEYDKAKEALNKAADSGNENAILLLGYVCLKTGDVPQARSGYTRLLQSTRPAAAYNGLALCDLAEYNYDGALQNIQQGLSVGDAETNRSLLFNEIVIYEKKLDFETAKQKMEAFLSIYPKDRKALRENTFLSTR